MDEIQLLLKELKEKYDLTPVAIERIFGLEQRFFKNLKAHHTTKIKTTITFLKLIKTFPFLCNVAQHNYDPKVAQKELLLTAVENLF